MGSPGKRSVPPPPSIPEEEIPIETIAVAFTDRDPESSKPLSRKRIDAIRRASPVALRYMGSTSGDVHRFHLPRTMKYADAKPVLARIRAVKGLLFCEADIEGFSLFAEPTDPLYQDVQWNLWNLKRGPGGANLPGAWNISTGSDGVVIAIIDSGIRGPTETCKDVSSPNRTLYRTLKCPTMATVAAKLSTSDLST